MSLNSGLTLAWLENCNPSWEHKTPYLCYGVLLPHRRLNNFNVVWVLGLQRQWKGFRKKDFFEEDNPPFPPLPFFVEPEVLKSSRSGSPWRFSWTSPVGCAICMNRSRAFCIEFLGKKHPSRLAIYPGKSKFRYELGTPRTQDSSHHQDDITFLGLGIPMICHWDWHPGWGVTSEGIQWVGYSSIGIHDLFFHGFNPINNQAIIKGCCKRHTSGEPVFFVYFSTWQKGFSNYSWLDTWQTNICHSAIHYFITVPPLRWKHIFVVSHHFSWEPIFSLPKVCFAKQKKSQPTSRT